MMKTLFTLLIIFSISTCYSQVLRAKDGTTVTVTSYDDNPDNFRKFNFKLGLFYNDLNINALKYLGLSYYAANKFYATSTFGGNSVSLDANILLSPNTKQKTVSQSVKSAHNTLYVAKIAVPQKVYPAPHIGASLTRLGGYQEPFLYSQFFCGFSIVKVMHAQLTTEGGHRSARGGRLTRMNFDFVGCTPYGPNELIESDPFRYRRIGARVYLDGQIGAWSPKGRFSFHYAIGVSYTKGLNYTSTDGTAYKGRHSVNPVLELGVGWSFW